VWHDVSEGASEHIDRFSGSGMRAPQATAAQHGLTCHWLSVTLVNKQFFDLVNNINVQTQIPNAVDLQGHNRGRSCTLQ